MTSLLRRSAIFLIALSVAVLGAGTRAGGADNLRPRVYSPDEPLASQIMRSESAMYTEADQQGNPSARRHREYAQREDAVPANADDWAALGANMPRPRLYLTPERVNLIARNRLVPPWSAWWDPARKMVDRYVAGKPPWWAEKRSKDGARQHGDLLPYLALAFLVTRKEGYLTTARDWMDRAAALPKWATDEDLGAAHLLFGMALSYDWLYDYLSERDKERYRAKMAQHAGILYRLLVEGKKWWARDYLQNHNYTNAMSLAVAGVALLGETEEAGQWLAAAKVNFDRVADLLSPDGASHEGVPYWGYGMDALLKYHFATKALFPDQDLLAGAYFRNATRFRLYASLPGYRESVNYGDSPTLEWYGPGYLLRALAAAGNDGLAQWLAHRVAAARSGKKSGLGSPQFSWLDLLWYDEDVAPRQPSGLPLHAHFENLGIFVWRSDWSDAATWFFFKAGPPQGHRAAERGLTAGSHIHPDQGTFMLWADGDWIIVDDGYVIKKRTDNHNVLTFNGVGQVGEGEKWFAQRAIDPGRNIARVVGAAQEGERLTLAADLAAMYPPAAGVSSWRREIVIDRNSAFTFADRVTLANPGAVEFQIHTRDRTLQRQGDLVCLAAHSDYALIFGDGLEDAQVSDYSIPRKERRKKEYGFYEGGVIEAARSVEGEVKLSYRLERRPECSTVSRLQSPTHRVGTK